MTTDFSRELDDSLIALKGRFNLGKVEQRGNLAQLVLLAEHAIKVIKFTFFIKFLHLMNDSGQAVGCSSGMHSALL